MNILLFKLLLTPALIGAISVAGRIWGPAVSGMLVGLPLTSGPVALFLALGQGPSFAAQLSTGILAGGISVGVFCLTYSRLAYRFPWQVTVLASWLAFLATTFVLQSVSLPSVLPLALGVAAALVVILALLPHAAAAAAPAATAPKWDIPTRMVIATLFVLALTEVAPLLGPRLAGLIAPLPIYTSILAIFTQHLDGPDAAARFMHGVMLGLFAFCAFFVVLALLLVPTGILVGFVAACALTLGMQAVSLLLLRGTRDITVAYGQEPPR
ncbi:MAG TPA: hypothetical protein VF120_01085 [Ktedonobacterales bacterium]